MTLTQIAEQVTERLLEHDAEARAFEAEAEAERGREQFESTCAAKFHDGCCQAYREVLDVLETLVDRPGDAQNACQNNIQF